MHPFSVAGFSDCGKHLICGKGIVRLDVWFSAALGATVLSYRTASTYEGAFVKVLGWSRSRIDETPMDSYSTSTSTGSKSEKRSWCPV